MRKSSTSRKSDAADAAAGAAEKPAAPANLIDWGWPVHPVEEKKASDAEVRASNLDVSGSSSLSRASDASQAGTSSPQSSSSGASRHARETWRRTERDIILKDIDQQTSRQQRRRLSLHVRRRRTELQSAKAARTTGRPSRGRSCYFSEGHVADAEARDVNAEASPYWMPKPAQELCYRTVSNVWRRQVLDKEAKAPYYQHYNFNIRSNLDRLRRLHIPQEVEDPTQITPGILDIDPDYFSIVEGRPENAATLGRLDIRKYLKDMREVLYTKLMIGYSEDHCMLINEQYTQELKVINHIKDQHQKHVKAFEAFLAQDHQKSMEILRMADNMTLESSKMEAELKTLNRTLGRLRNEVIILEDKWRLVKSLQRFLYSTSPRAWRLIHDVEFMKRMADSESVTSTGEDIGDSLEAKKVRSDVSLTELIQMFHDDVDNEPPPELYFKKPQDLLAVFDHITHLNMDMMLHAEQVRKPLDELYHTLQDARRLVEHDTEKLRTALKEKKQTIVWEEKRAEGLEAQARRVLDEVFKALLTDDDIIKLYVCVEDAFEYIVGPNDNNLAVVELIREIERGYEKLAGDLDAIPPEILAPVEDDVCLDEKMGFMKAKVAAKQLEHITRLEERMRAVMMAPPRGGMRPLVFRSPPFMRLVAARKTERKLGDKEQALLMHLTEYCPKKDADPTPFLLALRDTGMLE